MCRLKYCRELECGWQSEPGELQYGRRRRKGGNRMRNEKEEELEEEGAK